MSNGNSGPHWVCTQCKRPIPAGEGIVNIFNANPKLGRVGDYPMQRSYGMEDEPPPTEGFIDAAELAERAKLHLQKPNISFNAVHFDCDPYREHNPYQVPISNSLEVYVGWVLHLHEKTWMGRSDIERMLDFWWRHKGDQPPGLQ